MYNMNTEEARDHCHIRETETRKAKMASPGRKMVPPACYDLDQIYQVLSLHISTWTSNNTLIVWWDVSGRFLGPIK